MLALVNLLTILSGMRVQILWRWRTRMFTASTFTAGKRKWSRRPNRRSKDCPGSLWLRHGRSDFVVEDRKGRYKLPERGGSGKWLYKDNVANESRTFVHTTQRHVTLPALVFKFPTQCVKCRYMIDSHCRCRMLRLRLEWLMVTYIVYSTINHVSLTVHCVPVRYTVGVWWGEEEE